MTVYCFNLRREAAPLATGIQSLPARPGALQWHFESQAFSLEISPELKNLRATLECEAFSPEKSQESSHSQRILERDRQGTPFSPEKSWESSQEPKRPSCRARSEVS